MVKQLVKMGLWDYLWEGGKVSSGDWILLEKEGWFPSENQEQVRSEWDCITEHRVKHSLSLSFSW